MADELTSGIVARHPDILAKLRAAGLYKKPVPSTREAILAERKLYAGLPGFEATDYGKQALDDRRLTLALMGLSAAERGFGGMGTPPIPGEMAISTFGRGVLSPLAADVKPIAADYYGRKRQREIGKKAEEAGLSQAALSSVQARLAAGLERETTLVEKALDIAQREEELETERELQAQAEKAELTQITARGAEARKTADITGGWGITREKLIGANAKDQIKQRHTNSMVELETNIAASTEQQEYNRAADLFKHSSGQVHAAKLQAERLAEEWKNARQGSKEKEDLQTRKLAADRNLQKIQIIATSHQGELGRASSALEAEKGRNFTGLQGDLDRALRTTEAQFDRAFKAAQSAQKQVHDLELQKNTLDQQLGLAQEGSQLQRDLQNQRVRADADLTRLRILANSTQGDLDRAAAVQNEELKHQFAMQRDLFNSEAAYKKAIDVQALKNKYKERYTEGVTHTGARVTKAGATAMGLNYDDVKNQDFSVTYLHPKAGWDPDVVKPFLRISGGGASFDSINPVSGENVVQNPTSLFIGKGTAASPTLYLSRTNETISLPLGERSVAPFGPVMLTPWEYGTLADDTKGSLISATPQQVQQYEKRRAAIRAEYIRVGDKEHKLSPEDIKRSMEISRYKGEDPFYTELHNFTQGITGERGGINAGQLYTDVTRTWKEVLESDAWQGQPLSQAPNQLPTSLATTVTAVREERPEEAAVTAESHYERARGAGYAPNIPWNNQSELMRQAARRLPPADPSVAGLRTYNTSLQKEADRLAAARARVDGSFTEKDEISRFTELNRVYGFLRILNEDHDLLERTGKFLGGKWSQTRENFADYPPISSERTTQLINILRQLEGSIKTLQGDPAKGTSAYAQHNIDRILNLAAQLGGAEATNRAKVEAALAIVKPQIEAYGDRNFQARAELPARFQAQANEMGVDITVNENLYPWREPDPDPQPYLRMSDLDPKGISIKKVTIEEAIQGLEIGQKLEIDLAPAKGEEKIGGWVLGGWTKDGIPVLIDPRNGMPRKFQRGAK